MKKKTEVSDNHLIYGIWIGLGILLIFKPVLFAIIILAVSFFLLDDNNKLKKKPKELIDKWTRSDN